jgi:hypothetical protein
MEGTQSSYRYSGCLEGLLSQKEVAKEKGGNQAVTILQKIQVKEVRTRINETKQTNKQTNPKLNCCYSFRWLLSVCQLFSGVKNDASLGKNVAWPKPPTVLLQADALIRNIHRCWRVRCCPCCPRRC